jgi:serine O-acetyltransferase
MAGFFSVITRDAKHWISGTLYSNPKNLNFKRWVLILIQPEFRIILRYRIYNYLYRRGGLRRLVGYLLYVRSKSISTCDIHPEALIGSGLRIVHGSDIVIGPGACLGSDVVLFNGTTIGNRYVGRGLNLMPKVGNRVVVGTGAKLLGEISIGDDAQIGANAVVLISIPSGAVAVGIPAKILSGPNSI